MRFIHTADIHLGAVPNAGLLLNSKYGMEIWENFERLVDTAEKEQVDFLLIAGDLFHSPPSLGDLRKVDGILEKLTKTKVVLIAGNHDYLGRDSAYCRYEWKSDTYMIGTEEISKIVFEKENTTVYGMSYVNYENRNAVFDNIQTEEEDEERIKILLAHGGDEKHIPMKPDTWRNNKFSYIALGHIHKPGVVLVRKAAYAGALLPVDINDTGAHGYIEGEVSKEGCFFRFVPFAPREYIHLKVILNQYMSYTEFEQGLLKSIEERGKENLYKIILKGHKSKNIVTHKEWILKSGNIVEIEDDTDEDIDYQALKEKYNDGIVKRYMERFEGRELSSIEEKALKFGLEALTDADRNQR